MSMFTRFPSLNESDARLKRLVANSEIETRLSLQLLFVGQLHFSRTTE